MKITHRPKRERKEKAEPVERNYSGHPGNQILERIDTIAYRSIMVS